MENNNAIQFTSNGVKSVQQSDTFGRKVDTEDQDVSFRGNPIPEIHQRTKYQLSDSRKVIDSITSMTPEERENVTIVGIHYGDYGIQDIKLSTGDIVPIETGIALAENHMLKGYSTGRTVRGGRILRSKPDPINDDVQRLHDLPQF